MTSKQTIVSHLALSFVILGMGLHVLGFVTDFWCIGSRDKALADRNEYNAENMTDSDVVYVNVGLFRQKVEYENGIVSEEETSLKLKEEQILFVAIAGANTLLSFIICVRAIHILVGISSFIMMSLMLLSAFYTFEHTDVSIDRLQEYHSKWPTLKLAWSFICVFCGLLVNIVATVVFLTILLIKGERKAAKSSKKLGPTHVVDTNDKTPMVSVISGNQTYENAAYTNEHQSYSNIETTDSASFPATDSVYTEKDIEITIADKKANENPKQNMHRNSNTSPGDYTELYYTGDRIPDEPYTDLDAVESDDEDNDNVNNSEDVINSVSESIHL